MAQASRPLLAVVVVSVLLVAVWLLTLQPTPSARSQAPANLPSQSSPSPFAPVGAIDKARDAAALSDAANARIQAQGAAAENTP